MPHSPSVLLPENFLERQETQVCVSPEDGHTLADPSEAGFEATNIGDWGPVSCSGRLDEGRASDIVRLFYHLRDNWFQISDNESGDIFLKTRICSRF